MSEFNDLFITCAVVWHGYKGGGKYGWAAQAEWNDSRFAQDGAVTGVIGTKYYENTLSDAVDAIEKLIKRLNLQISPFGFSLLYKGDGEDPEHPAPENYKALLADEAEKRGWKTYHSLCL